MALADQTITIIGAGVAGLSCAIALARTGHRVKIYERAVQFEQLGAGIQLSPNATRVLHNWGVDIKQGQPTYPNRISIFNDTGKALLKMTPAQDEHSPYIQIYRPDLIDLLADAANKLGVRITFNHPLDAKDGADPTMLIAADGIHSQHRPKDRQNYSGFVAWRALLQAPQTDFALDETRIYLGRKCHLVLYPLRGGQMLNLVAVTRDQTAPPDGWHHQGDGAELQAAFAGFAPNVQNLLRQASQIKKGSINIHHKPNMIGRDGVFLAGDAAQTMLPFMAQGAGMAIEDAAVLAQVITKYTGADRAKRYQTLRAKRRAQVMAASIKNGQVFHEHRPLIRPALHNVMALIGRINPNYLSQRYAWIYDYDARNLDI